MNTNEWVLFLVIGLVAGGLVGALAFPHTVIETQEIEVPVIEERIVNNTVNQTVEVEVEVDNGNLDLVLQHIYDNDGNVNYLTSDLDDDEIVNMVDRVIFINEVKKLAIDAVKDELFDEVDGLNMSGVILDDHEMERLKIDSRDYEILVDATDFEDGEALITVTGTFEQDGVLYEFEAILEFDEGEFDRFDNVDVAIV